MCVESRRCEREELKVELRQADRTQFPTSTEWAPSESLGCLWSLYKTGEFMDLHKIPRSRRGSGHAKNVHGTKQYVSKARGLSLNIAVYSMTLIIVQRCKLMRSGTPTYAVVLVRPHFRILSMRATHRHLHSTQQVVEDSNDFGACEGVNNCNRLPNHNFGEKKTSLTVHISLSATSK